MEQEHLDADDARGSLRLPEEVGVTEILVIDDDEFMLSTTCSLLSSAGFDTIPTADGPQGIELFQHRKPAAVILDLGLPSMDGLQVLKQIRQIDPEAKVIVITGYPSDAAAKAARAMGAAGFIPKPFTRNDLIEKIETVLRPAG